VSSVRGVVHTDMNRLSRLLFVSAATAAGRPVATLPVAGKKCALLDEAARQLRAGRA
jgi:hypothetical protein